MYQERNIGLNPGSSCEDGEGGMNLRFQAGTPGLHD